jgi:hypothetical protein
MSDPYAWWYNDTSAATTDHPLYDDMPATANGHEVWISWIDGPPPKPTVKKKPSKWLQNIIRRRGKM